MRIDDTYLAGKIDSFLIHITGYILFVSSILSLQNNYLINLPKYYMFIFGLIGLAFYYVLSDTDSFMQRGSTKTFLIVIISLIILLRLIWITAVPTLPYSDFGFYNSFGISIAEKFPDHLLSINYNERGFGYAFVLGIIYKILGVNLFAAKLLNVFLSVLIGILLYLITGHLFDQHIARISTVLFAIWPAQIMYNSVLASEHLFIFVIFLGIAILIRATKVKKDYIYKHIFLAGIIFGLAYTIRFLSLIVLGAGFITLLSFQEETLKKRLKACFILIAGFTIVWSFMTGLGAVVDIPSDPRTGIENSLLIGTNYESTGHWNPVDYQVWDNYSPEEAKKIAFEIGLSRITQNPDEFIKLIFEKFNSLWCDESFGTYWSTYTIDSTSLAPLITQNQQMMLAVSQFYYFGILALSSLACYKLRGNKLSIGIRFLILIFLSFVILHSFLEVQSRYHYPWELIFIILGGYGIGGKSVVTSDP